MDDMDVYDSVVMNGSEWSRMAANCYLNGCEALSMVINGFDIMI